MEKSQEHLFEPLSPEELMHERFTPWVARHNDKYKGQIADLGYDPVRYPSQRIEEFKTPAVILRPEFEDLSEDEFIDRFRQLFEFSMGSKDASQSFVDDFGNRPAFNGSELSYSQLVVKSLDEGKKIGLVCDHAEDLGDIVKASAGLGLAIAEKHGTKYIPSFNIWINKLMTRETYLGFPVDYLGGLVGNVRWAMPNTDTAEEFGFTAKDSLTMSINQGILRSYIDDLRVGTVESLVPGGSGMEERRNAKGELESLYRKPTSDATAQLLGHMDILIPVCVWKNTWEIGEAKILEGIKQQPKPKRAASVAQVVGGVTSSLAQYTEKLSGVPVHTA